MSKSSFFWKKVIGDEGAKKLITQSINLMNNT